MREGKGKARGRGKGRKKSEGGRERNEKVDEMREGEEE